MNLDPRSINILSTIVEEYIASATPVGSRTVSKKSSLRLSPATIRNIMADLTDEGYLEQPHTSAGRVPTTKGFRFYLDTVLRISPLSNKKQAAITSDIAQAGSELSDMLRQASKLLSTLSDQVSMVMTPSQNLIRWQKIDFILLRPGMAMSILVMQGGLLRNKVIKIEKKITSDDLIKYGNYLNQLFEGRTIFEVREVLVEQMQNARKQFDDLYQQALNMARQTFKDTDEDSSRELYVEGTVKLLDQPEFSDMSTMRGVFSFLEERSQLLEILDKTIEENGLNVLLGLEKDDQDLETCCLVSSPYSLSSETFGVVGIIGPIRMNYAKVIPAVDFTAQILSELLKKRF